MALTTAAEEPHVAVTSSRIPHEVIAGETFPLVTSVRIPHKQPTPTGPTGRYPRPARTAIAVKELCARSIGPHPSTEVGRRGEDRHTSRRVVVEEEAAG